jgi:hypothetical protein
MVKVEGEGERTSRASFIPIIIIIIFFLLRSEHSSHNRKKHSKKSSHSHDLPLLKLDVKFDFPTYDGELNVEKLDNWVKQIEVYCRVQKFIEDDSARIQLATLRLIDTV